MKQTVSEIPCISTCATLKSQINMFIPTVLDYCYCFVGFFCELLINKHVD